ncbi:hypothetical protein CANARDRAFT_28110 [[Candida] arabinofermentans NRRL YB-2248]|uniref:Protein-S-isoprenylcysteine O-methyltransferase n=1 Tax=[Candida] arabinofermentans NRRL YB-2248 TaxID=983967 RepID=A0A1E4T2X9_9ASCO|nr:hypothetical protein CANARDRAFT_28110 [[Candida] arabinofermentans NRRL YB-2248]
MTESIKKKEFENQRYDSHTDYDNLLRIVNENSLPTITLTSLVLGILIGISTALLPSVSFKQILLYVILLCTFHFLEYYTTAKYSFDKVNTDSFLIFNGFEYLLAHTIAITESLIEIIFFPKFKLGHAYISIIGFLIVLFGQYLRSMAMVTAGESFSHIIAQSKKNNHKLITHGIYGFARHPSYAGFFYWALGTQLLLCNPLSFVIFYFMLHKFFSRRIRYEECKLVEFFGDEYVKYKKTTPTRIPFV